MAFRPGEGARAPAFALWPSRRGAGFWNTWQTSLYDFFSLLNFSHWLTVVHFLFMISYFFSNMLFPGGGKYDVKEIDGNHGHKVCH